MGPLLANVFEFLFKYRPVVFENGRFVFGAPWPVLLLLGVGLVLLLFPLISYLRVHGRLNRLDKAVLTGLRIAVLGLVVFCLLRPMLVVATVVPQENYLGILLDDSRSMQIVDGENTRSEFIREQFGPDGSDLVTQLADRFKLRLFGFSESIERVSGSDELTFTGNQTRLGQSLDRARAELSTVPLAGLVVFTDGADNSEAPLNETIMQLRSRGVPVHAVGIGRETFDRDIEITRVEAPRAVLQGSAVAVDVMIMHSGYSGETVQLNVEDGGRIVSSQDVELPRDGEIATVQAHFEVEEPGPRLLRFHIPTEANELVEENNEREVLVLVRDRREKILYFEGEPRFEVKFLRRAVADDENLQVVIFQRLAENKFKRLDVDDPDELAGGFPTTREELFQYRGLILGSVEASFFTHDQLQMIAEFVGQRGGGLLVLGGKSAFAEGGYANTPVDNVLPVVLQAPVDDDTDRFFAELDVELTPFGQSHPVTQISGDPATSEERWAELPAVSTVNPIFDVKPGASTLITGSGDGIEDAVVLAFQRFGRGRVIAFPVQDSWIWQMHADIPLEDMTHETYWRQLLRWLISSVPDPVIASIPKDRVGLEERVTITTEVTDSAFLKVNDADVRAYVLPPSGVEQSLELEWTVEEDGEYVVDLVPQEEGLYEIRVSAERAGEPVGEAITYFEAAEPVEEYFGAQMRSSLLRRIADETGGRFYTPETVATLPEDVRYTESGSTVYEEKDLWDMPIVFMLLVGLVATEWGFRRYRGLI
ncbi:MAG: hypothetical protein JSW51_13515 [Gemmatimonadota bacterium]|nr:MAG: hypothetical protein JSW51_13515 [Gemmatimonadota bacterium]